MTKTVRFIANTTFQQAAAGPLTMTVNPEIGYSLIFIGTSVPGSSSNTFLLKPVAGENYLEIVLENNDKLYVKSKLESSAISWIEKSVVS